MKMHSKKGKNLISLVFLSFYFFVGFSSYVFAADIVAEIFSSQTASGSGSNNSLISVNSNLLYINKGNNSSTIGNYFQGYYYDTMLGYFKTDWSSNAGQNVRVIGSTSQCPVGYGYKLGGYAYSSTVGLVDFDYNSNIFVYYCIVDKNLYGYSYSPTLGFQNFSGLSFEIETDTTSSGSLTGTGFFTNDTSDITSIPVAPGTQTSPKGQAINSNFTSNTIQFNKIEFESLNESLFYIIK